jgi:two-component system, OmpR family, response regulator
MLSGTHILVVEDDPAIGEFLVQGLADEHATVKSASDGVNALALIRTTPFDAAVVDLMLPKLDGLSVIEAMRKDGIITPVVVLSAKRSVEDKVRCLRSGADDYLQKPFDFSELLARLEAVMRRAQPGPEVIEAGGVTIDVVGHTVRRDGQRVDLQPREFALLELLMRNRNRPISKTELLQRLWDYSFDPQTSVVDVLVCRLRNKVDRDFPIKRIHNLRGVGYVFRAD